jgi:hypothetical protein
MVIRRWPRNSGAAPWCALILGTTLGCGGEEFQSGSGGTSSGGASSGGTSSGGTSNGGTSNGGAGNGGTSGSGASGGVGTGGVAASGGEGGGAGEGGTPNIPGCALKPGAPILLHTTLDDATAIQTPDSGIPPGDSNGQLVPGKCPTGTPNGGLAINTQGDFLTYSGEGNINLVTGTADFYFKPAASDTGVARHLLSVPGKFQILIDQQGNLVVGVGQNVGRTILAANVPFSTDTWVRVTITWKFGDTGETVFVYFDGNGVSGPFSPGPFSVPSIEDTPLFIGANGANDPQVANGVFDDIKIYDGTEPP